MCNTVGYDIFRCLYVQESSLANALWLSFFRTVLLRFKPNIEVFFPFNSIFVSNLIYSSSNSSPA